MREARQKQLDMGESLRGGIPRRWWGAQAGSGLPKLGSRLQIIQVLLCNLKNLCGPSDRHCATGWSWCLSQGKGVIQRTQPEPRQLTSCSQCAAPACLQGDTDRRYAMLLSHTVKAMMASVGPVLGYALDAGAMQLPDQGPEVLRVTAVESVLCHRVEHLRPLMDPRVLRRAAKDMWNSCAGVSVRPFCFVCLTPRHPTQSQGYTEMVLRCWQLCLLFSFQGRILLALHWQCSSCASYDYERKKNGINLPCIALQGIVLWPFPCSVPMQSLSERLLSSKAAQGNSPHADSLGEVGPRLQSAEALRKVGWLLGSVCAALPYEVEPHVHPACSDL
jgi:hypothetical protein